MADGRDAGPGWRRLHLEAGDVNLASGASTLEVMEGAHRYNRWIYDRVRDGLGQRVLEIGCGTGTITSFMVDRQLVVRSEEHTSELQSRFDLVCRLLLEK